MIASLAHRASGMVLIFFIFFYICVFSQVPGAAEGMQSIHMILHSAVGTLSLWLGTVACVYHLSNGIRFLCLDAGEGESPAMMRMTAWVVFAITLVSAVVAGVVL